MSIEETALNIIRDSKEGVFQNELWKVLEIDSRKCSRVVSKLLDEDLIIREQAVSNGARTYLLKVKKEEKPCFNLLLSGEMFSPCAGCRDACQPESCEKLTAWVENINLNEKSGEIC